MIFLKILAAMALSFLSTGGCIFALSPILEKHKNAIFPTYFCINFFITVAWYKIFDL